MQLSAPGKVFLTGEYAVLWGAPAIVAGVAPRIEARLEKLEAPRIELSVPGAALVGELDGGVRWSKPAQPARFVQRALELGLQGRAPHGFSLRFRPSPRGKGRRKIGLGTSAAAATVAAAAGLTASGEALDPAAVFRIAAQAHWEVQGQRGSNGDVAASCWGKLVRYARWPMELEPSKRPPPDAQPLEPRGLALALVFSGKSAKTPSMVAAVEAALTPAERQNFVSASAERTEAFTRALDAGELRAALDALDAAGDLLDELGQRAGVPVLTPALARLQAMGRERGLAAKVTGAGGGDSALLASFDAKNLEASLADFAKAGHQVFPLQLSPGVRAEGR